MMQLKVAENNPFSKLNCIELLLNLVKLYLNKIQLKKHQVTCCIKASKVFTPIIFVVR
jgi:hypothetical protein